MFQAVNLFWRLPRREHRPDPRHPRSRQAGPETMLSAEALDLIQLDVGVLRLRHRWAGYPPVGAGQSGRQIGPGSGLSMLPGPAGMRNDCTMRWLPQPDKASLFAEHDGVVPPPDHRLSTVRRGRDGYQVTGRHPLRPRRREGLRESNRGRLSRPENLTCILLNAQNDSATQRRGSKALIHRSSHALSVSRRVTGRQNFSGT